LIVWRGRGVVRFYFKKLLCIVEGASRQGAGWRLISFSFSFDLWKGEGKGVFFNS
jgi:hypothetical protein